MRPVLTGLVLMGSACDPMYDPPCRVVDRQTRIVEGLAPQLVATASGDVIALADPLVEDDDPSTRLVEVAVVRSDGDVRERWTLEVPVPAVEVLGGGAPTDAHWVADRLGVLQLSTELLLAEDGEPVRSAITYRTVSTAGEASDRAELPGTACTDCLLSWQAVPVADRLLVVYRRLALTDDLDAPLEPARTRTLLLEPDGLLASSRILPWSATAETVGPLRVDADGTHVHLASHGGVWVLDGDLQPIAGPFLDEPSRWALDASVDPVQTAWSDADSNLFVQEVSLLGDPGEALRLSALIPVAVQRAGDTVGTVAYGSDRVWFTTSRAGQKLGGEVEIADRPAYSSTEALFVERGDGFAFFLGREGQVDRIEVACAR